MPTTPDVATIERALSAFGLCRSVVGIDPLVGGENSQVFEVRCAGPDRSLVLKVYPDHLRWKMAKEVFVFALVDGSSPPTPRVLAADDSSTWMPEAFLVTTMLPGRLGCLCTARRPRRRARVRGVRSDPPCVPRDHVRRVRLPHDRGDRPVPDERRLHGVPIREEAPGVHRPRRRPADPERGGANGRVFVVVARALQTGSALSRRPPRGNVLGESRGGTWTVSGVLDVENAVAGDPLLDIAKTEYYAVRGNAVKRRGLLEGYGPLPPDGEKTLRLYRLYHAVELWDWFASVGRTEPLSRIAQDIRTLSG